MVRFVLKRFVLHCTMKGGSLFHSSDVIGKVEFLELVTSLVSVLLV